LTRFQRKRRNVPFRSKSSLLDKISSRKERSANIFERMTAKNKRDSVCLS
jgi:hypothetical protein